MPLTSNRRLLLPLPFDFPQSFYAPVPVLPINLLFHATEEVWFCTTPEFCYLQFLSGLGIAACGSSIPSHIRNRGDRRRERERERCMDCGGLTLQRRRFHGGGISTICAGKKGKSWTKPEELRFLGLVFYGALEVWGRRRWGLTWLPRAWRQLNLPVPNIDLSKPIIHDLMVPNLYYPHYRSVN